MPETMPSQLNQLPPEVLHGIFYHLDIPDILRIQRVSRYLNEVGRSRDVWADAYRKAEFVRPPGPFLWQSPVELEKVLVSSFRVDRNLRHGGGTTQKERPARKLKEIRFTGVALRISLVFSRFLVVAFREEVRCYDLNLDAFDSDSGASIIHRSTGGALLSFHCVSSIDLEGHPFACVVLFESVNTRKRISTYLLNVGEASDVTLDPLHQFERNEFEIESVDLSPRMIVIQGRLGRNYNAAWHAVAIDVHARMEFGLPPLTPAAWAHKVEVLGFSVDKGLILLTSISTSTHLLLAWSFHTLAAGWNTFIQAFTLPPSDTHRRSACTSTPLSLSHSSVIPGIQITGTALHHDSTVDPITQDVLISIRAHSHEPSRPFNSFARHGILRLSTIHTSHSHGSEACTVAFQPRGSLGPLSLQSTTRRSFDGIGRVFYASQGGPRLNVSAIEYDLRASSSSDDGEDMRIVEYFSILQFPAPRILTDYDPYSGRICLQSTVKYSVIEILDLAV